MESLFSKVAGLTLVTLLKKETLTQVFSCEYCEICKNNYFEEHLQKAASEEENSYQVLLALFFVFFLHISCIKKSYMFPTL